MTGEILDGIIALWMYRDVWKLYLLFSSVVFNNVNRLRQSKTWGIIYLSGNTNVHIWTVRTKQWLFVSV